MINIIEDVSTLSTVSDKVIDKLFTKMIYCICDAIVEAKKEDKEVVDLNIGLGTLSIKISDEDIKYKFIPSSEFQEASKLAILEERNLLEDKLEQSFVDKLTNLYKDLI